MHGLSQNDLADKLGMSQSAVSMYMNGVNGLNLKSAIGFSRALGVPIAEFSPRLARMLISDPLAADRENTTEETPQPHLAVRPLSNMEILGSLAVWDEGDALEEEDVQVPYYAEVEFSGGDGITEVVELADRRLRFSSETLRAAGVDKASAAVAKVRGNSMERLILDGAAIGFDMSDKTIQDGDIYAFNHGGMLRVKYLYRLPHGGVRISSENSIEYPDELLTAERWRDEVRMLGRVFWWSTVRRSRRA